MIVGGGLFLLLLFHDCWLFLNFGRRGCIIWMTLFRSFKNSAYIETFVVTGWDDSLCCSIELYSNVGILMPCACFEFQRTISFTRPARNSVFIKRNWSTTIFTQQLLWMIIIIFVAVKGHGALSVCEVKVCCIC